MGFPDDTFADYLAAPELVDVLTLGVQAVNGRLYDVFFLSAGLTGFVVFHHILPKSLIEV